MNAPESSGFTKTTAPIEPAGVSPAGRRSRNFTARSAGSVRASSRTCAASNNSASVTLRTSSSGSPRAAGEHANANTNSQVLLTKRDSASGGGPRGQPARPGPEPPSASKPITQLGEDRGSTLALDVGAGERRRYFQVAREHGALHAHAQARRRRGFAAGLILLPGSPDVVEAIGRDAAGDAAGIAEVAAQFQLAADAAVTRDLGHFEPAAEAVAADLEALAVGQDVSRCLREGVEAHRPSVGEPPVQAALRERDHEIGAARIDHQVAGVQARPEPVDAGAQLQVRRELRGAHRPVGAQRSLDDAQPVV